MAIIVRGKTNCSLCGSVLAPDEDVIGTPHFIHDIDNPLWRFSDSGMHRECFMQWPEAAAFRAAYDRLWNELTRTKHPRKMLENGDIVEVS